MRFFWELKKDEWITIGRRLSWPILQRVKHNTLGLKLRQKTQLYVGM